MHVRAAGFASRRLNGIGSLQTSQMPYPSPSIFSSATTTSAWRFSRSSTSGTLTTNSSIWSATSIGSDSIPSESLSFHFFERDDDVGVAFLEVFHERHVDDQFLYLVGHVNRVGFDTLRIT